MTISRSKNKDAYGFDLSLGVPWAYAANGGTISTFVATNANPNNKVGATYRVHKFTSIGAQSIFFDRAGLVDVFVVGGGGQGGGATGSNQGGGGGGGGVLVRYQQYVGEGLSNIFVGNGGSSSTTTSFSGQDSYFNQHIALGGGYGATNWNGASAQSGGCGGGDGVMGFNTRGVPNQGFGGGYSWHNVVCGGGGGAGEPGGRVNVLSTDRPDGGDGLEIAFENNTPTYYAGGGVGGVRGTYTSPLPTGGLGGGGNLGGTPGADWNGGAASFYGGGGGGAARPTNSSQQIGGAGYQGIVIIRYIV